jgi:hypothetical protein
MDLCDNLPPVMLAATERVSISLSWQKTSFHAVPALGFIAWMALVIDAV